MTKGIPFAPHESASWAIVCPDSGLIREVVTAGHNVNGEVESLGLRSSPALT